MALKLVSTSCKCAQVGAAALNVPEEANAIILDGDIAGSEIEEYKIVNFKQAQVHAHKLVADRKTE